MAAKSFQHEVPKARVNITLDLHTGGASRKVELPLKLMLLGDYSNGREQAPLSARNKVGIDKNNFDSVLGEFSPRLKLAVPNTLAPDLGELAADLRFDQLKDFEPEQVARQIPQLRALLAMRNLLRDLKSNLLDNATFRHELERILKDPALSAGLHAELAALAPR
ncbi:type VI secretion system contractile sheath small subunit [Pseudomonas sp. NPDC007930]|uniref:type VI secretion system contractile sheath small subunit n=1 Tax=Pseudomonas sp. NPDC007930 TaxID=3364417 RepID=UPI0036F02197